MLLINGVCPAYGQDCATKSSSMLEVHSSSVLSSAFRSIHQNHLHDDTFAKEAYFPIPYKAQESDIRAAQKRRLFRDGCFPQTEMYAQENDHCKRPG